MYRQLQILNKMFNESFGDSLLPLLNLSLGTSFIGCISGVIKMMELRDVILLGLLGKLI